MWFPFCHDVPGWRRRAFVNARTTLLHIAWADYDGGQRPSLSTQGQQDQQVDGRDRADREDQAVVLRLKRAESLVPDPDAGVFRVLIRPQVVQHGVPGALGPVHAVERERRQLGARDVDQREQGQDLRHGPRLQAQQYRVRGRQEDPRRCVSDCHIQPLYFARIYFALRI